MANSARSASLKGVVGESKGPHEVRGDPALLKFLSEASLGKSAGKSRVAPKSAALAVDGKARNKPKKVTGHSSSLPKQVALREEHRLRQAVDILLNTRPLVRYAPDGSELKEPKFGDFDAPTLSTLRAMLPPGKQYSIRLASQVLPYATDASGNMLTSFWFSPSVTTFPEWAGFAALFDEVVLRRVRFTAVGGASSILDIAFAYGTNPNNVSASPGSATAVTNLNDSDIVNSFSYNPVLFRMKYNIPPQRAWAETTTPAVASPPAGCVGSFDFANAGASGHVSITYFFGMGQIVVSFRNRI
jgi:hypothetical protein